MTRTRPRHRRLPIQSRDLDESVRRVESEINTLSFLAVLAEDYAKAASRRSAPPFRRWP